MQDDIYCIWIFIKYLILFIICYIINIYYIINICSATIVLWKKDFSAEKYEWTERQRMYPREIPCIN